MLKILKTCLTYGFMTASSLAVLASAPAWRVTPSIADTLSLPDTIPPAAPTGLTARAIDGVIKLTWNTNAEGDLSRYEIFRGEGDATPVRLGRSVPGTVTEFLDDSTGIGFIRYTYQITAVDSSENESLRSAPVKTSTLDTIPPAAPAGLTAQALDGGRIKLIWNANIERDLARYIIFRGEDGATPVRLGPFLPRTATEFIDTTTGPGFRRYTYQIAAGDVSRNESPRSAPVATATLDSIPPAAPTGLTAVALDGGRIRLTWAANTERDLARYNIYRGVENAPPARLITVTGTVTEFIDTTTGPSIVRYTYQIAAGDFSRNESPRSAPVTVFTIDRIAPATPANFAAQAGNNQVVLTWSANTERDLSFYSLHKSVNGGPFTFITDNVGRAVTYTDRNVTNGNVYAYQISVFDFSRNESARSAIVSVTLHAEGSMTAYPNPTSGMVQVQLSGEEKANLTVRSLSNGALIHQGTYQQQSAVTLDLGNVPKGTYLIDVQQGDQTKSVRVQVD